MPKIAVWHHLGMELHELHTKLAVEIVYRLLSEIRTAGGDAADLILILTSVVAGAIQQIESSPSHGDALLAALIDEVRILLQAAR